MPVFTAWTPMSSTTLRYWARTASTGSSHVALHAQRVLRGDRGEHAHAVHAERQHRLQVGLDARTAAGVGPGDGEHAGRQGGAVHAPESTCRPRCPEVVPAARHGPRRSVDRHLRQRRRVEHLADHPPAGRAASRPAGRSRRSRGPLPRSAPTAAGRTPTAWPMSFICDGDVDGARAQIDTDLAGLARCARGRPRSPSLTSVIAVAPSPAAAGPAWYGGSGRRCASTKARGERKPRESTACPAADQPSQPVNATTSPGPGAGPGDRLVVAQVAQRGDGERDGVAAHHVAADHRRARHLALVADAVHQLGRPR